MPKMSAAQAKEELMLLFQGITRAVGAVKDYAFLDRHLGDAWCYTDFNGVQRGKADYLKLIESIVSYEQDMTRFDVRIAGEGVAIITGTYQARAELRGGVKADSTIAFSAVWGLEDGVWRALLHHTTRIA